MWNVLCIKGTFDLAHVKVISASFGVLASEFALLLN